MILVVKNTAVEGPGTFLYFLEYFGLEIKILSAYKGEEFPSVCGCEGIIILGGPMNVYENEKFPFLSRVEGLIREALKKEIPLMGICLGAQLIAKISGAKVRQLPRKAAGWYSLKSLGQTEDYLLRGLKEKIEVFQWYEDSFDIHSESVLLFSGENCRNQAFRIGNFAWGFQFHPEMNYLMIEEWSNFYKGECIDKEKLLQGYFNRQPDYLKQARLICSNFKEIVSFKRAEKPGRV